MPCSPSSPIHFNRNYWKIRWCQWREAGSASLGTLPGDAAGLRGAGWRQESYNTWNSSTEALLQEEKFLSSPYCNPALQRRIRGGLSYSEPRSLYSRVTDFTQRFNIIWKIPVDFTRPRGYPVFPKPACLDGTLAPGDSDTWLRGGMIFKLADLWVRWTRDGHRRGGISAGYRGHRRTRDSPRFPCVIASQRRGGAAGANTVTCKGAWVRRNSGFTETQNTKI